jgi:hypothetical protein
MYPFPMRGRRRLLLCLFQVIPPVLFRRLSAYSLRGMSRVFWRCAQKRRKPPQTEKDPAASTQIGRTRRGLIQNPQDFYALARHVPAACGKLRAHL